MASALLVSKVLMPERGLFTVRVDEGLILSGTVSEGTKGRFVVSLDYGEDVGMVIETANFDPAVHGARIPGFRLVRPLTEADGKTLTENETLAATMRSAFLEESRKSIPDLRLPSARLSFGRRRLFLRYVSEQQPPDFSAAQESLRRRFGVDASLWAMGPRDEVAECGGLASPLRRQ